MGAKVILLKNLDLASDKRLVNGSIGTVIRWASGPKEVDYDSVTTIIDGKMGSPSKHERKSVVKHKEERIQKWLEANPTKVPIVRDACHVRDAFGGIDHHVDGLMRFTF